MVCNGVNQTTIQYIYINHGHNGPSGVICIDYIGSCKSNYYTYHDHDDPSVMIGTDCIGSCKSNYHSNSNTTTVP